MKTKGYSRLSPSNLPEVQVPRLPECCSWTVFFHGQAQVKTSPDSMSPDLSHTPSFRTQAENPVRPPTNQTSTDKQNKPPPRPETLPDQKLHSHQGEAEPVPESSCHIEYMSRGLDLVVCASEGAGICWLLDGGERCRSLTPANLGQNYWDSGGIHQHGSPET
ncbi:hypothetical protein CRENBAI_021841 [Crenichthys baileyi]|uniref:Uncharacterized protein n=1 Tax=Crenichthys baileyi TaxID=28760 RepID=A0AAV9RI35_9TELE